MSVLSHIRRDADGNVVSTTLLAAHLQAVANAARAALASGDETMQRLGALAGLTHDFGKFTSYFQAYLQTGVPHPKGLQQHAFISALYAAFTAYRAQKEHAWLSAWDPLLIYLAVKHHHGDFLNLDLDVGRQFMRGPDPLAISNALADPLDRTSQQVQDLTPRLAIVEQALLEAASVVQDWLPPDWQPNVAAFLQYGWWQTFDQLVKDARVYRRTAERDGHIQYIRLLGCFSALIDADKRDAAQLEGGQRPVVPTRIVDDYVYRNFSADSSMANVRWVLYEQVTERASANAGARLFTLTAPTGSGKTLSALAAAMQLRRHAVEQGRMAPRIIYAMPFTSIIDQNAGVLRSVLSAVDGFTNNESQYLLVHHHLAPVQAQRDGVERPVDEALMLQEAWDSEFIVTTYVQLFDTLLGYRNRALKRFHRLTNAILILDEVQSLPAEYWPLIGKVLELAARASNVQVILMTATQPRFLTAEAVELAGDEKEVAQRFTALDRVDLHVDLFPLSIDAFVDAFLDEYDPQQSYLLIFNTIHTSIEVFQRLQQRLDGANAYMSYLSGNVVPAMRRERVDSLRATTQPVLIVATQVVEAGVDLDVHVVYRELAPLDAVVQSAGRCNRNNTRGRRGAVRVFQLQPESGRRPSMEVVYKRFKAEATMRTLRKYVEDEQRGMIREAELPKLVTDYFQALSEQISSGDSSQIWQAVSELNFAPGGNHERLAVCDFQLITEYPSYVNLFVECNDAAADLWAWYQDDVRREPDWRRRQENYLRRKAEFHGYILSVHRKRALALGAKPADEDVDGLWYLPGVGGDHAYYDPMTGLAYHPEDVALML
ncbi:CRISPR-associated helicase Cas3' [Alicyclobacillus suci]|uniref:CRISPR-associated helicase Cas3' n=1 Tax=Alicyclobacillus suci TaxID=2816080 RepID=UPI001A8DE654|nr:CRISPR-associated helicase Cas3' [Alicyclobacillus suci]